MIETLESKIAHELTMEDQMECDECKKVFKLDIEIKAVVNWMDHMFSNGKQRNDIQSLHHAQCVLVSDYMMTIRLAQSLKETDRDFDCKDFANCLGMMPIWKESEVVVKHNFFFLSADEKQDSFFTSSCLEIMLRKLVGDGPLSFVFWADCGSHFHSSSVIDHLNQLQQM